MKALNVLNVWHVLKCDECIDHPQGVAMSGAHDVISGERLTLTCKTTSSNPEAEITWYDGRRRQLTSSVTSEIASTTVRLVVFTSLPAVIVQFV